MHSGAPLPHRSCAFSLPSPSYDYLLAPDEVQYVVCLRRDPTSQAIFLLFVNLRRLPHLDTCVLVRPTTPNIYQTVDKDSESACEIALKKAGEVKTLDALNERTSMVADEAEL